MFTSLKTCFKCQQAKPLSEFYAHKEMADGHLNKCKTCTKNDVSKHREENLERAREYDRARANQPHRAAARYAYSKTLTGKLSMDAAKRKWDRENPHKKGAINAVNKAVRSGALAKEPCFVCGEAAEAHHAAYDLPLHVTWLCDKHHKQVHKEHREHLRSIGVIGKPTDSVLAKTA